ncbi:hypothetical protein ACQP00_15435 [Dactylosporangium sp. CS-047395]|uniref:hypothetical protein n=1 Tax=Dactylosporangium sp. CS-047395 TaxID=3239936 RepID=UPI003D8FB534
MGHSITALLLRGPVDEDAAREWDVEVVPLAQGISLVHVTHYYAAVWQFRRRRSGDLDVPATVPPIFPTEAVLLDLAAALAAGPFALIQTDYFGGVGDQWACLYDASGRRDPAVHTINDALRALGVRGAGSTDAFDEVGLGRHRHTPERLERYETLCDELGL